MQATKGIMFSFLGLRKDPKKSPPEKEAEGGFVLIGETADEQRTKTTNIAHPSTNVVVQRVRSSCPAPAPPPATRHPAACPAMPAAGEASALPDLLGDVPFTLAPHVLSVQAGLPRVPDVLLSRDVNYNLANFQYDFTLENSVLQSA
uniref:UBAP1-MVB12-associated (UMA) domain containing 1 n=1 Tax=Gasterosteus aculeatus aculeatus TaxID=481459 RepID=A0AAQ4QF17_GASAC